MIGIGSEVLLTSHNKTSCLRNITEYDYRVGTIGVLTHIHENGMYSFEDSPPYHVDDLSLIKSSTIVGHLIIHSTEHYTIVRDTGSNGIIRIPSNLLQLFKVSL